MKTTISLMAAVAVAGATLTPARAGDSEWATAGKILTGVVAGGILASAFCAPPIYAAPPPVYVAPAPVYRPAPIVVAVPVVAPAPVYYAAPPPVYYAAPPPVYYVAPPPVVVHHPPVWRGPRHGHGPGVRVWVRW